MLHVTGTFYSVLMMSHSVIVTDLFQECRKQNACISLSKDLSDFVGLTLPACYMLRMFVCPLFNNIDLAKPKSEAPGLGCSEPDEANTG